MKQKFYKVLSIILTLAMVFTACVCAFGTVSAAEGTYYVGTATSETPDGSATNPYATVVDAITAANTADTLAAGDTLNILALEGTAWGTSLTPEHTYNIVVKSNDTANPVTISDLNKIYLGGPTTFDSITVSTGDASAARFYLKGNNFTLTDDAAIKTYRFYTGQDRATMSLANGQTVVINGSLNIKQYFIIGSESKVLTYTNDLDITVDDSANKYSFIFGLGKEVVLAKTRVKIKAAKSLAMELTSNCTSANGSLELINSTSTALDSAVFDSVKNKWIINNNSGIANVVDFTSTSGKYAVNLDTAKYTFPPSAVIIPWENRAVI